jgi:hypothetical protein
MHNRRVTRRVNLGGAVTGSIRAALAALEFLNTSSLAVQSSRKRQPEVLLRPFAGSPDEGRHIRFR